MPLIVPLPYQQLNLEKYFLKQNMVAIFKIYSKNINFIIKKKKKRKKPK
jgi:hypothetical protein